MIRSLRRRHRQVFLVLAVLLPALFISGLVVRRSIPLVNEIPIKISTASDRPDLVVWNEGGLRLGPGADVIDVVPMGTMSAPDLLLYWSPQQPVEGELDGSAILIGLLDGVRGQRFSLPPPAREVDGFLIAWSLAHRRMLAFRPWPKGGGR